MKKSIVLTTVRSSHEPVIHALIDAGVRTFATYDQPWSRELLDHLRFAGGMLVRIDYLTPAHEKDAIVRSAQDRAQAVIARLAEHPIEVADGVAFSDDRPGIGALVANGLAEKLADPALLVRCCEYLAEQYDVLAVVVSEDIRRYNRAVIQWAQTRSVPTFHITHGAYLGLTRYDLPLVADYVLVPGKRGAQNYEDCDIDPARIIVTGYAGWDGYRELREQRDHVRSELRARLQVSANARIVVFATTAWQVSTALAEHGVTERTLNTFLDASAQAQRSGVPFVPVVKDRPTYGKVGAAKIAALAERFGARDVVYLDGPAERLLAAADILVASDSNMSIEAILAGVPAMNIWAPQSWISGPYFDAGDGIDQFSFAEPDRLAERLREVLESPSLLAAKCAAQFAAIDDFTLQTREGAARATARAILERTAHSSPVGLERLRRVQTAFQTTQLASADALAAIVRGEAIEPTMLVGALGHARVPSALLAGLKDTLPSGAPIIVCEPNTRSLFSIVELATGHRTVRDRKRVRAFSCASLVALIERAGFDVERVLFIADPRLNGARLPLADRADFEIGRLVFRDTSPADRREFEATELIVVARAP